MTNRKKILVALVIVLLLLFTVYLCTGFFVIQPIGAIPEGTTVWFIRIGTKLPFITSADGILLKQDSGVSIFGRAMMITTIYEIIEGKIISKLPYNKTLYSISTNGTHFVE